VSSFTPVFLNQQRLETLTQGCINKLDFTEAELSEQLAGELAELSSFRYCELFNSGSSAILAACIVSKQFVDTKQTVQVPSFSFPSLYNGLYYAGYNIELIDVDAESGLANTQGELTVHQSIADQKPCISDNFSIEDCAWSLQSVYKNKPTFSMLSMGNSKLFNCGSGGALFYDDDMFTPLLKQLKFYGATGRASQGAVRSGAGMNLKFDDWRAALILAQLCEYPQLLKKIDQAKQKLNLDNFPASSIMYLVDKSSNLTGFKQRRSWEPLHTFVDQKKVLPNSDYCYNNKVIVSTNFDE